MSTKFGPAPAGAIVVGIDSSALSDRALAWAAAEAERSNAPLHVVHAFVFVSPIAGYDVFTPAYADELGRQVVAESVAKITDAHPDLSLTAEVRAGPAAQQLLGAAAQARMIVLGARGRGWLGGRLVGSVSQQVAMHAPCPVLVVRGPEVGAEGPVVVGMDGSAESVAALLFALRYAAGTGAAVRVVRAEYLELPAGLAPGSWRAGLATELDKQTAVIRSQIDEARRDFPGVEVDLEVVEDHPEAALVAQSQGAGMLVVASRGLGGFTGLLLGSVSQGVLTRADVPVAIVPRVNGA